MALDAEQILRHCYDSEKQALRIATDGPAWTKYTYAYDDFVTSGEAINGPTLPAGTCVHAVKMKPSVKPAGTSLSAATLSIGVTGTSTKYVNAYNVFQDVAEAIKTIATNGTSGSYGVWMENHSSTTQVILTLTTTNCTVANLTAGTFDVWLLTSVAT